MYSLTYFNFQINRVIMNFKGDIQQESISLRFQNKSEIIGKNTTLLEKELQEDHVLL